MFLSVNMNRKLGKKIGIFNLPAGKTCPGATPECGRVCYARKAERMYKSAREKRELNLEFTKHPDFVALMVAEIHMRKLQMVRFHESGDVYAQVYLDKIFVICTLCPDVKFLMYTKSFHLDFSKKPANLVVYWSTTDSNVSMAPSGVRAHIVLKGQTPPAGYITCDQGGLDKHYCGVTCMTCWEGKHNVYFDQH